MLAQPPPPARGRRYKVYAQVVGNPATGLPLAGFWSRFAGIVVDGVLFAIVDLILSAILTSTTTTNVGGVATSESSRPTALIDLILVLLELAYFTYFWSNSGATPGQMLVGIKVVDKDSGENLRPSQAALRWAGLIISAIPIFIGYIWAAFDPQKQGWMDKLANSQVVATR